MNVYETEAVKVGTAFLAVQKAVEDLPSYQSLAVLGQVMNEIVGEDPPDDDDPFNVVKLVHDALDLIDEALAQLTPES